MQIYVSNLSTTTTDDELRSMFEQFGKVAMAKIGRNKKTNDSEGYGIVEMPVKSEVRAAVDALRGKDVDGKPLLVRVLKPGDPFHSVAHSRSGAPGGYRTFTGDGSYRGGGAIRRGGQRGS